METIPIIVTLPDEDEDRENVKGILSSASEIVLKDLPVAILQANLNRICNGVITLVNDVKAVGNFRLKEITIQVEISAEGGVELIGTAKLGGKGAITLTFSE